MSAKLAEFGGTPETHEVTDEVVEEAHLDKGHILAAIELQFKETLEAEKGYTAQLAELQDKATSDKLYAPGVSE